MTERKRYGKPPVDEVAFRFDFPLILRLSNELPYVFQEKICKKYPVYNQQIEQEISIVAGGIGDKPIAPTVSSRPMNSHTFQTENGDGLVTIAPGYFYFSTRKYVKWEEFKEEAYEIFNLFREIYAPQLYTRVGLRYLDVFVRSRYGLNDKKWSELINPEFLGQLSNENVDGNFFNSACDIKFIDSIDRARITVAIVVNDKDLAPMDMKEKCLLFDTDVYVADRIPSNNGEETLERLHSSASLLFKSISKPILDDAMEPMR